MQNDCKEKIISQDYADFMIKTEATVQGIRDIYNVECVSILYRGAIIFYDKISDSVFNYIRKYGYSSIPKCYGLMDTSALEESGVLKIRRQPNINLYGNDVIIGFVDTGIDYTNDIFKNADGTTRILKIWDQTIQDGLSPIDINYGTEYTKEDIDKAINSDNPFSIVKSVDENGHGTQIASVAAGNIDDNNDFSGIAPFSDIVVVKLKQAKNYLRDFYGIPQDAQCFQENDIIWGIKYLLSQARDSVKPIVICLGIGTNLGGHDGTSVLSLFLNDISTTTGISVIVAGGNEVNFAHHYQGRLSKEKMEDNVELRVGHNRQTFVTELWTSAPNIYSIGLTSPSGETIMKVTARESNLERINFLLDGTIVDIFYNILEKETGDEVIIMRFQTPSEGIWNIHVYNETNYTGDFHIWLPIRPFINDIFFLNPNPYITICSPANTRRVISCVAYDSSNDSIYINSSRGYTRIDEIKPDITAPGVNVYVGLTNNRFGYATGTCISAAIVAGIVALLFEWGVVQGNNFNLNTTEIKKYLIFGARQLDGYQYPNRIWGYGIVDIYSTFFNLSRIL